MRKTKVELITKKGGFGCRADKILELEGGE